jgi:hypothetical protein
LPTAICLCAHFAQPLNLVERDAASLACRQAIQFKRSNSHADNPQDFMAQLGQHTPDFAIFPFRQDDFKPHAFALRLEAANAFRLHLAVTQPNALQKAIDVLTVRAARNQYTVCLFNPVTWMGQSEG